MKTVVHLNVAIVDLYNWDSVLC